MRETSGRLEEIPGEEADPVYYPAGFTGFHEKAPDREGQARYVRQTAARKPLLSCKLSTMVRQHIKPC